MQLKKTLLFIISFCVQKKSSEICSYTVCFFPCIISVLNSFAYPLSYLSFLISILYIGKIVVVIKVRSILKLEILKIHFCKSLILTTARKVKVTSHAAYYCHLVLGTRDFFLFGVTTSLYFMKTLM